MKTFDASMTSRFEQLLCARERELCALLGARDAALHADELPRGEVTDFKEGAAEASLVAVDAAQAENAGVELEQVLAARRRLRDNEYGSCLDCGDPIPLERLLAMPAAPYCVSCQGARERQEEAHAHHH